MKAAGVINLNTSLTNLISAGMSSQQDQGTVGEMNTVKAMNDTASKAMNDTATKAMNDTVSTQERQVIVVKKSDLQLAQDQDMDIMQKYEHM